jgi:hypothetical protein
LILSNVEIHGALDEGRLVLTPEPAPRFPEEIDLEAQRKLAVAF